MNWWLESLLEQALLATWVFLAVWPLCRFFGRRSPALSYALWSLVLLRLVVPASVSNPLSLGALWEHASFSTIAGESAAHEPHAAFLIETPASVLAVAEIETSTSPVLFLGGIWCFGASFFLLLGLWERRRCARILRSAHPIEDEEFLARARVWTNRLGIRRRVRWLVSDVATSPFTVGVLRPTVFLPRAVLGRDALCESALAHELVHVARWDALRMTIQHAVRALYFFHPLVWLAGARLDHERERICDAAVLAYGDISARDYANSLLSVAALETTRFATSQSVPRLLNTKRRWTMRIQHILNHDAARLPRTRVAAFAALLLGFFLLPAASTTVAQTPDSTPMLASDSAAAGSGEAWTHPLPEGRTTAQWGNMKDPWNEKQRFHKGVDLAAAAGTPVLAPRAGRVELATVKYEKSEDYGTVVILDHGDGLKTFYAHLGSLETSTGDVVESGAVIARVGSTGRSTGPHLHFEIWRDGEPIDPSPALTE